MAVAAVAAEPVAVAVAVAAVVVGLEDAAVADVAAVVGLEDAVAVVFFAPLAKAGLPALTAE